MVKARRGRFRRKRVAVVLGGFSVEQEISQLTGETVARVLSERGYNVTVIRAGRDLPARLSAARIDVVFNALHGRYGEDGCVQGLLEVMGIPYTGSGVHASALGMSKSTTKRLWEHAGLPTPPWCLLEPGDSVDSGFRLPAKLPLVVKPDSEGSSVGVSIVRDRPQLTPAVARARKVASHVILERYVAGKEVTVGLLDGKALTAMEVIAKGEFHSYEVKYTPGLEEFVLPAGISERTFRQVLELAQDAYRIIRSDSYARVDLRVTTAEKPFLVEINTLPGLTQMSYLPKMAEHTGLAYPDLVERILDGARLKLEEGRL